MFDNVCSFDIYSILRIFPRISHLKLIDSRFSLSIINDSKIILFSLRINICGVDIPFIFSTAMLKVKDFLMRLPLLIELLNILLFRAKYQANSILQNNNI